MTDEEIAAQKEAEEKAAAAKKAEEEAKAAEEEARKKAEDAKNGDGKPSEKEAELLKDVMKWKAKAKEAEEAAATKAAEAAKALKAFEGIDPEAARKAMEQAKEAERKKLESKGEYERIVAQINEDHAAAIEAVKKQTGDKDAEIESLKSTINKLTIGNSFGNSTFITAQTVLTPSKAEKLYGEHFDIEDGTLVAYDKPRGASERTRLVNTDGKPLPFEKAIEKIVASDPDFETIKKSKMKPGANSDPVDGKPKGKETEVTGVERIRASLAAKK